MDIEYVDIVTDRFVVNLGCLFSPKILVNTMVRVGDGNSYNWGRGGGRIIITASWEKHFIRVCFALVMGIPLHCIVTLIKDIIALL